MVILLGRVEVQRLHGAPRATHHQLCSASLGISAIYSKTLQSETCLPLSERPNTFTSYWPPWCLTPWRVFQPLWWLWLGCGISPPPKAPIFCLCCRRLNSRAKEIHKIFLSPPYQHPRSKSRDPHLCCKQCEWSTVNELELIEGDKLQVQVCKSFKGGSNTSSLNIKIVRPIDLTKWFSLLTLRYVFRV